MFTARIVTILNRGAGGTIFTTATPTIENATDVSSVALPANASRMYALIINLTNDAAYVGLGHDPTAAQDIILTSRGSNYEITLANLFRGAIHVVRDAGKTGNIVVIEGV